jgi:hypothetical protein
MTTASTSVSVGREPELLGQTVVLIAAAPASVSRLPAARRERADVVLTGRDPKRLERAALDVDARSTAAFDANDPASPAAVVMRVSITLPQDYLGPPRRLLRRRRCRFGSGS